MSQPQIDWDSIIEKANKSKAIKQYWKERDDYMMKRTRPNNKFNAVPMKYLANKFIREMQREVRSLGVPSGSSVSDGKLGPTAVSAFTDLQRGDPRWENGEYRISISFAGNLHRQSLVPESYDGVENIAALLNSGYNAHHAVRGVWAGHGEDPIYSRPHRSGAHFIDNAIRNFNTKYSTEYGVKVNTDPIYGIGK